MTRTVPGSDAPGSRSRPVRVLLVDDHAIVRAGLRMLIEASPGLIVVGEAGGGAQALAAAESARPDIILLDLDLGGEDGLDLIPSLLAKGNARILVLTGVRENEAHRRAFHLGAVGLVEKEKAGDVLIKAIHKVSAGEVWIDRATTATVLAEMSRARDPRNAGPEAAKIATLTPREREVIRLIGEGLGNRALAERLFISETTVRHHLTSIYDKLQVRDRLDLLAYAYRNRLVNPPSPPARG